MAIQSSFYTVDGSTRTFPSTKHIATKQHCAVYLKDATLLTWSVVPVGDYSLINNSIVFDAAPSSTLHSEIEIRVVDTQGEIVDSPSDIALVAGSIANVNTVATNIASVNTTATNIGAVNTTSGSIANVNATGASIANVNLVAGSLSNVNTVATSIADVNSVATTIVPNIAEILLADTNAATATTKAAEAVISASNALTSENNADASELLAYKWAEELEDVVVAGGEYSAHHWAIKAAASAGGIIVDSVPTDGSLNSVSSNGVFDALALKANSTALADYLPKAGGDMIGTIRESYAAIGASDIAVSTASVFSKTISGATTFTLSAVPASPKVSGFTMELTNGGSAVVTWWAGIKWTGGTAPTLTAAGLDILEFYTRDGGTTWRGFVSSKDNK